MHDAELEQEVINLSKEKWRWMAERDVDTLDPLFHEKAMFVHMGGAWGKNKNSISLKAEAFTTSKRISTNSR